MVADLPVIKLQTGNILRYQGSETYASIPMVQNSDGTSPITLDVTAVVELKAGAPGGIVDAMFPLALADIAGGTIVANVGSIDITIPAALTSGPAVGTFPYTVMVNQNSKTQIVAAGNLVVRANPNV
jgi:ABC-type spermidine/putrescine transport system permease subunit II